MELSWIMIGSSSSSPSWEVHSSSLRHERLNQARLNILYLDVRTKKLYIFKPLNFLCLSMTPSYSESEKKILGVSNQNLKHLEVCWYFTQAELWTYELTKPIDNKLKLDLRAELELGLRVKLMPLQLNWKRTKLWTALERLNSFTPLDTTLEEGALTRYNVESQYKVY